jgi:hypothetical protein
VGDDVNPCSRTAPCKTFAGAISKTTTGGEIDVLDPGGFGTVTITKSISIEADGLIAGITAGVGTNGITIAAGAGDVVVLRGITIDGVNGTGTNGIRVLSAGTVIVEKCNIAHFATRGISIEPTNASGLPTKVFISDTNVQGNASNGIVIAPGAGGQAQVALSHVNIVDNTNFGLSITGGSVVTASDTIIAGNAVGTAFSDVRIDGSTGTATLDLDRVSILGAPTGIASLNNAVVSVSDSTIVGNATAVSVSGGGIVQSYGNNRIANGSFTGTILLH